MNKTKLLATVLITVLLFFAVMSQGAIAQSEETQTITDMAGRTVTIPKSINRLIATGQPGAVMLYTLCPALMVAWNSALADDSLPYIPPAYASLPVTGSMQGGKISVNPEEIAVLHPDVIIYMTTITKTTAAKAEDIQSLMNIPVITVSFDLMHIADTYRFMGTLLSLGDKADTLADFCDSLTEDIAQKAQTIPQDERITFYYTSGGNGLQTSPSGTNHTEMFELVGGINVVDLPAEQNGRLKVDMERILSWNPDCIIASTPAILQSVLTWEHVDAVTQGKGYSAPTAPFSWLDAPVSINRLIGLCWAAETLYPDVYQYDLADVTKTFYQLFYDFPLTDAQLVAMLP